MASPAKKAKVQGAPADSHSCIPTRTNPRHQPCHCPLPLIGSDDDSVSMLPAATVNRLAHSLSYCSAPRPLLRVLTLPSSFSSHWIPPVRDSLKETDGKGNFKRVDSVFRHIIEEGGEFPPESGRYHLYVANACPWANRCHMILTMKGLEDAIGVSVVHPVVKDPPSPLNIPLVRARNCGHLLAIAFSIIA